jgi:hypothetical protein
MKKFALLFLLTSLAYAVSSHTVTISWATVAAADTYYVYRGTTTGVCQRGRPYALVVSPGGAPPPTTYTDSNPAITDGEVLYYNVSSVTSGVESTSCGGEIMVTVPTTGYTPPSPVAAPAAPTPVTFVSSH